MSHLIPVDRSSPLWSAVTLMYTAPVLNEKGIEEVAETIMLNYISHTKTCPDGMRIFCNIVGTRMHETPGHPSMTPEEIIESIFFQNMRRKGDAPSYHGYVEKVLVPKVLNKCERLFPQVNKKSEKVKAWLASFLESYMNEAQLKNEEVKLEEPRAYINEKCSKLSPNDLSLFLELSRKTVEQAAKAENVPDTLRVVSEYIGSFATHKDPNEVAQSVLASLRAVLQANQKT